VHALHGEAGAEGAADADTRAALGPAQEGRHVPHCANAEFDVLVVARRRRDGDGRLADAGQFEHDELARPEGEVPPVLIVDDADAVEVLLVRELVDARDLRLVGELEAVEVRLAVVLVVVRDHVVEGQAVVHASVLLSPDARDDLGHGDPGEARLAAAAAAHAERFLVGLDEPAVLVIVAVLEPAAALGTEIVAAGHLGEVHDVAGILYPRLLRVPEVHRHGLLDAVAVAGGADIGAGAAAEAFIAPFLPDGDWNSMSRILVRSVVSTCAVNCLFFSDAVCM